MCLCVWVKMRGIVVTLLTEHVHDDRVLEDGVL